MLRGREEKLEELLGHGRLVEPVGHGALRVERLHLGRHPSPPSLAQPSQ